MYLQNKAVQQSEEVPRGMEVCCLVEDDTEDSYQEGWSPHRSWFCYQTMEAFWPNVGK